MGEGGAIGSPPAVFNAVADARGVTIDGPVRPADVLALLAAAAAQGTTEQGG